MTSKGDILRNFWGRLKGGSLPYARIVKIPRENVDVGSAICIPIVANDGYFSLTMNEMHLSKNRRWYAVADPLVVFDIEFIYKKDRIRVSRVVGPNLIKDGLSAGVPEFGTSIADARVVGPHPYRGDSVSISIRLVRMRRTNYVSALLNVVDSLSKIAGASQLSSFAHTGSVIQQGFEGLLGLKETTSVAANQTSLARQPLDPLLGGYFALIAPPMPVDESQLIVRRDRLLIRQDGKEMPYRASDFVLFSIAGATERNDMSLFPFYELKETAIRAAAQGGKGTERGRASLFGAYQQMLGSDDMTANDAKRKFDDWCSEFSAEVEGARARNSLGCEGEKNPLNYRDKVLEERGFQIMGARDKAELLVDEKVALDKAFDKLLQL